MNHLDDLLILPILTTALIYGEYRLALCETTCRRAAFKGACWWGAIYFAIGMADHFAILSCFTDSARYL